MGFTKIRTRYFSGYDDYLGVWHHWCFYLYDDVFQKLNERGILRPAIVLSSGCGCSQEELGYLTRNSFCSVLECIESYNVQKCIKDHDSEKEMGRPIFFRSSTGKRKKLKLAREN